MTGDPSVTARPPLDGATMLERTRPGPFAPRRPPTWTPWSIPWTALAWRT